MAGAALTALGEAAARLLAPGPRSFFVVGAVLGAADAPFAWQVQRFDCSSEAAARWLPLAREALEWQTQYLVLPQLLLRGRCRCSAWTAFFRQAQYLIGRCSGAQVSI